MGLAEYNSNKGQEIINFLYYWGRPIRAGDISRKLNIKHSTLNSVLIRIQEQELINWEKYGMIELTMKGKEYAAHLTDHHFIIERFLHEHLEMEKEKAHSEAMTLSGVVSCDLITAICSKLGISHDVINPQFCEFRKSILNN